MSPLGKVSRGYGDDGCSSASCDDGDLGAAVDSDLSENTQIYDFVEFFAGKGGTAAAVNKSGNKVVCALEAFPQKGSYRIKQDLELPQVRTAGLKLAQGHQIRSCHFGDVCTTWGALHMLFNGGTRSRDRHLGDGSMPKGVSANHSVSWTCDMLVALHAAGRTFTIKNPARSILCYHPRVAQLVRTLDLVYVYFDQCEYGLRSPKGSDPIEIWKKPTYILTNSDLFNVLERKCKHGHEHTWIKGQIKVEGKYFTRSKLAGAYPSALCRKLANVFVHILDATR